MFWEALLLLTGMEPFSHGQWVSPGWESCRSEALALIAGDKVLSQLFGGWPRPSPKELGWGLAVWRGEAPFHLTLSLQITLMLALGLVKGVGKGERIWRGVREREGGGDVSQEPAGDG